MNCRNCGAPASNPYHCAYCNTTLAARGDEASEWDVRVGRNGVPVTRINRRTGAVQIVITSHRDLQRWMAMNGVSA